MYYFFEIILYPLISLFKHHPVLFSINRSGYMLPCLVEVCLMGVCLKLWWTFASCYCDNNDNCQFWEWWVEFMIWYHCHWGMIKPNMNWNNILLNLDNDSGFVSRVCYRALFAQQIKFLGWGKSHTPVEIANISQQQ